MTKSDIIKQLKSERNAPFMSLNDVAKAMRIGKNAAAKMLSNTDYIPTGNSRRYLIDDVAEAIMQVRER